MEDIKKGIKIKTGEVRASYLNVFKPVLNTMNKDKPKLEYTAMLIIDSEDKDTLGKISGAIKKCCEYLNVKDLAEMGQKPLIKDPSREEKKKDDPIYKGKYYINVKNNERPPIAEKVTVEGKEVIQRIEEPGTFKSGHYCKAVIVVRPFMIKAENGAVINKGITLYLQNMLKTRDGEELSGGSTPEEDFKDECETGTNQDYEDFMDS